MSCSHTKSCELYPLMAMEPALKLWQKNYCEGAFARCARYALSNSGRTVPLTLLPNGEQLAPRSTSEINTSALFNAIQKGRIAVIRSMMKAGVAKMGMHTSDGLTPLMAAARVGNVQILSMMLEHGCNPWLKNQSGKTAYDIAKFAAHKDCTVLLKAKMATSWPDDFEQLPIPQVDPATRRSLIGLLKKLNPFSHL